MRHFHAIAWMIGWVVTADLALAGELGDAAPPLKAAAWIKGDAVDLAAGKGKNVFVLEFWATWSAKSRDAAPLLSEIQKKFRERGVTVVGVTDEPAATVKPFVEKFADRFGFSVACDEKRATTKAYMSAFGVSDVPHAFIVDKESRIVWHGGVSAIEPVLAAVVAGKHSIDEARNSADEQAAAARSTEAALAAMREYFELASTAGDEAEIRAKGGVVLVLGSKNAKLMNEFAWTILTDEKIKRRDKELALRAAKSACDATADVDATFLDTHARALFDSGDVKAAIERQKKAIETCADAEQKKELESTLKKYEKKAGEGG